MEFQPADIQDIWMEILKEKIIKKNAQYGNSVYDTDTIFSDVGDPEELIKIRLDDKMRRLKTLDTESEKYDSELMEIIAYIMHLLNWRRNSGKTKDNNRHKRDEIKSPQDTGEVRRRRVLTVGIRGLPGK